MGSGSNIVGAFSSTAGGGDSPYKRTTSFVIACSDETTALTTGNAKVTFRMPYAYTLDSVRASLTGAGGASGTTTIDINEAGSTILSTKITIDYGDLTSVGASAAPVISDSSLASDAQITIDIDALTGDADETGLKVYLIGNKTL
tara:strand:- start:48 stop:482 length:435 start_codon:yes stop_codon:yes gene_type:complete